MENGLITFFEIEECGFYRSKKLGDSNKRTQVHVKGYLKEALDKVTEWAKKETFLRLCLLIRRHTHNVLMFTSKIVRSHQKMETD
ncbi:hypothetical protein EC575_21210 [Vibrio cholerae]|nr:hypothetical protein EC575_21210 [Vibrio cholerae]